MARPKVERRRYPRYQVKLPTYYMATRDPKVEDWTTTRDVSREGLCLFLDRPLPVGTKLHLEIDLPERIFLTFIKGTIAWSEVRPTSTKGQTLYRTGVKIKEFGPFDARRYAEFIGEVAGPRRKLEKVLSS